MTLNSKYGRCTTRKSACNNSKCTRHSGLIWLFLNAQDDSDEEDYMGEEEEEDDDEDNEDDEQEEEEGTNSKIFICYLILRVFF